MYMNECHVQEAQWKALSQPVNQASVSAVSWTGCLSPARPSLGWVPNPRSFRAQTLLSQETSALPSPCCLVDLSLLTHFFVEHLCALFSLACFPCCSGKQGPCLLFPSGFPALNTMPDPHWVTSEYLQSECMISLLVILLLCLVDRQCIVCPEPGAALRSRNIPSVLHKLPSG